MDNNQRFLLQNKIPFQNQINQANMVLQNKYSDQNKNLNESMITTSTSSITWNELFTNNYSINNLCNKYTICCCRNFLHNNRSKNRSNIIYNNIYNSNVVRTTYHNHLR